MSRKIRHGCSTLYDATDFFQDLAAALFAIELSPNFLKLFYGLAACSWMPHWACHYYRLETQSTFIVGSWAFSYVDSVVSLLVYTFLVAINLISIAATKYRIAAAALTGIGHISLGMLHAYRLINPFTFEVFGYQWSYGASLREALVVIPFGLFSMFVAFSIKSTGVQRL